MDTIDGGSSTFHVVTPSFVPPPVTPAISPGVGLTGGRVDTTGVVGVGVVVGSSVVVGGGAVVVVAKTGRIVVPIVVVGGGGDVVVGAGVVVAGR